MLLERKRISLQAAAHLPPGPEQLGLNLTCTTHTLSCSVQTQQDRSVWFIYTWDENVWRGWHFRSAGSSWHDEPKVLQVVLQLSHTFSFWLPSESDRWVNCPWRMPPQPPRLLSFHSSHPPSRRALSHPLSPAAVGKLGMWTHTSLPSLTAPLAPRCNITPSKPSSSLPRTAPLFLSQHGRTACLILQELTLLGFDLYGFSRLILIFLDVNCW